MFSLLSIKQVVTGALSRYCKPNKVCWELLLYKYISFVITLLSIDEVMGQIKINKNLLVVTGCHIFGYYNGKFLQAGHG